MASPVEVRLIRSPWSKSIADNITLGFLNTAAAEMYEQFDEWFEAGKIEEGRDSFAAVILDPTQARWAKTIRDLVIAIVMIGPEAARFVPNATAKADGHDRHDLSMRHLMEEYPHLLGDSDFAYGESAEYDYCVGGGSGLSPEQDGELVLILLKEFIERVNSARQQWLADRRNNGGKQAWWNAENTPGLQYESLLTLPVIMPASS